MATTVAVFDFRGRCIGRCDAKCHDAEKSECTCVCGGANHGCGQDLAFENTERWAQDWVLAYQLRKPDAVRFDVYDKQPVQLPLFPLLDIAYE